MAAASGTLACPSRNYRPRKYFYLTFFFSALDPDPLDLAPQDFGKNMRIQGAKYQPKTAKKKKIKHSQNPNLNY